MSVAGAPPPATGDGVRVGLGVRVGVVVLVGEGVRVGLGVFVGVAVFVAVAVAVAVGEGGSRFGAPGEGGPSYHVSSGARLRLTSGELPV